jgi:hypothetical protein
VTPDILWACSRPYWANRRPVASTARSPEKVGAACQSVPKPPADREIGAPSTRQAWQFFPGETKFLRPAKKMRSARASKGVLGVGAARCRLANPGKEDLNKEDLNMKAFQRVVSGVMAAVAIAGKAICQTPRATARNLEYDYSISPPYTGVIESYRNFIQALSREKSRLRTTGNVSQLDDAHFRVAILKMTLTDRSGNEKEIYKNGYLNTAPPMTADEMRSYFTAIGESGNAMWRRDNRGGSYGQGLRQAELYPNPAGFFIIAVDPDDIDHSNIMWLVYDEAEEEYKARELPAHIEVLPDGTEHLITDIVAPISILEVDGWRFDPRDFITESLGKWGGMAFIRFGTSLEQHTALDPSPNGEDWRTDLERRVGERIYDASRIAVETLMPDTPGSGGRKLTIDGKGYRIDVRWLRSHDEWFHRTGVHVADLRHPDGTRIRVAMLDLSIASDKARHIAPRSSGFIELRYCNEVHDVYASHGSHAAKLREFGIWHAQIANRVAILIEPPVAITGKESFAIEQDKTRGGIRVIPSGTYISDSGKFREWAEFVAENLPAFVMEALLEAAKKDRPKRDSYEVVNRVMSVVSARLRATLLVADTRGTENGDPTDDQTREPAASGTVCAASDTGDVHGAVDGKAEFGGGGKPSDTRSPRHSTDAVNPAVKGDATGDSSKQGKEKPVLRRHDHGRHAGQRVEHAALPQPIWHESEDEFAEAVGGEYRGYPVFYDLTSRFLHFNALHPQFRQQHVHYTRVWAKQHQQVKIATLVPMVAELAIRRAYEEVMFGIILQTLMEVTDHVTREEELSPAVLRVAIRGFQNASPQIERLIWEQAKEHRARTGSAVATAMLPATPVCPPVGPSTGTVAPPPAMHP